MAIQEFKTGDGVECLGFGDCFNPPSVLNVCVLVRFKRKTNGVDIVS